MVRTLRRSAVPHGNDWPAFSIARPQGFTLIELISASILLAILFSTALPMFVLVARERHSAQQRQLALQQVTNLLEQARQRPWSELEPGTLPVPDLEPHLKVALPGIEQALFVQSIENERDSRQIIATVRWKDQGNQFITPIRMSSWVFHSEASQ